LTRGNLQLTYVIINSMALPKEFRLKKRKNFEKIKNKGQKVHTPLFVALILKGQKEGPKFGFVVSKKIDKKAVGRNKIRRRLSEAVKGLLSEMRKDIFVILLTKRNIKNANYQEIKNEIKNIDRLF
jgi:ribonuclease P protein component